MLSSWRIGSAFGIGIYLHWTFALLPASVKDRVTTVSNGVNVQALLDAREVLKGAPEAAQFTWRATSTWTHGVHSTSSGIAEAEMAPMLRADGAPLHARGWYDTEALASDGDTFYVGIERVLPRTKPARCCPECCPNLAGDDQRVRFFPPNPLILLAPRAGLEPATKRLTAVRRS